MNNRYIVTCICVGDSCDRHATKIGAAETITAAQAVIDEDKACYLAGRGDSCEGVDNTRPDEIWGERDTDGRIYDIIEA